MDKREREEKEKKLAFLERRNAQREKIKDPSDDEGGMMDAPEIYVEDRAALKAELNPKESEAPKEESEPEPEPTEPSEE